MIKRILLISIMIMILPVLLFAGTYDSYNSNIGFAQGGNVLFVKAGGSIDSAPSVGSASPGLISKLEIDGTGYSGTVAGLTVRTYMKDTDVTVTGGLSEFTGLAVFAKQEAALDGGKSSIITLHQHDDSTVDLDFGMRMFGDVGSNIYLSGNNTNLIYITAGTEGGFTSASLKNSDGSDIKCDAYMVIENEAVGTFYMPLYNTLNS